MFENASTYLAELRESFRLVDAIDIALISILLYAGLVWFKRAASRGVIVGVSVAAIVFFVARALDMYLTSLVFQMTFAVLLVVLVVLFQEEIRRGFERMANWGTLGALRRKPTVLRAEVDAVVEAAFALAGQKVGALIVFRGREPLDRHVNGGIRLFGYVSKPLLYSIFDPSSAGHDGAVIVAGDRIEKFGAHLPISKNHAQIRGRGTRHSAALGLAECSDALVVVVSEERGAVSVAERSKLVQADTAADLKARIERFLADRFPPDLQTTWKRFVLRDIRWKLTAVLLAVVAWFVLAFSFERVQTSLIVPIEYRNLPENVQIDESAPAEALVTVTGSETAFRLLDRRVLKISVDLSGVKVGTETVPIMPADVRLPPRLRVDRIQPDEIQLELKQQPPKTPKPAAP